MAKNLHEQPNKTVLYVFLGSRYNHIVPLSAQINSRVSCDFFLPTSDPEASEDGEAELYGPKAPRTSKDPTNHALRVQST